ncbi:hypothetical protein [Streptomyces althioticus]|uniref:hypothetical protein n=1 Tax=Streptomyces althioticus TaxID=83380 RepID=UPI0038292436
MVDDEAEPMVVKLGVWNIHARRDKLTAEQLDTLRKLCIDDLTVVHKVPSAQCRALGVQNR